MSERSGGKRKIGGNSGKLRARRELRATQAAERQAAYDALTLEEKIAKAESRGGPRRELARLRAQQEEM